MRKVSEENENVKQGTKHAAEGGIVLKKKHIVVIAIIILLLLFGGVFVGLNWNNWFGENEVQPTQTSQASEPENSVDIDPNAGDWTGSKPVDQEPSSKGIKIPGYPSITIAANTKNVTMALLNPEENPCYFKFEIVLKDTDETIFESKYVEPGKAITDVELKRPLSAGEYPAIIKISTLSLDGSSPMNGANVETVLAAK